MKFYIKNFFPSIKWILFSLIFAIVFAILVVLLVEYKILPKEGIAENFNSFSSFDDMKHFGFLCFFVFFIFMAVAVPLKFKFRFDVDLICPSCENVETVSKIHGIAVCKKCGVKLVPLKGFYDNKK